MQTGFCRSQTLLDIALSLSIDWLVWFAAMSGERNGPIGRDLVNSSHLETLHNDPILFSLLADSPLKRPHIQKHSSTSLSISIWKRTMVEKRIFTYLDSTERKQKPTSICPKARMESL